MTWEQKFKAMRSLNPFGTVIRMRDGGNWYVSQSGVERKEGACLSGGCNSGQTIEQAVNEHWEWLTDAGFYIVIDAYSDNRRAVRWNGFMWEPVVEEKAA